jgi:serine/threonine protein kinase
MAAPASSEALPRQLGRYVVVEHLASGGMGSVYLALQSAQPSSRLHGLERVCVVKTIRPAHAENRAALTRFIDEARTSLLLHHKNLCTSFDVEEVDGVILLAMEHIAGRNLRAVWERLRDARDLMTPDEIVALGAEALDGLEHAHNLVDPRTGQALHLVHRDISPQNVMVSFAGDVKVIDFGVARSRIQTSQTAQGSVVGKMRYMAAEQIAGRDVDRRADVAAMGMILIELLSGARFFGEVSLEDIWKIWRDEGWRSEALDEVPEHLRAVLERAVVADPQERWGSAAAFKDALVAAAQPVRAGALKRAMARLFPGDEDAWRAHLQGLYRTAEAFVAGRTPLPRARNVSADAPTRPRVLATPMPDDLGVPTQRVPLTAPSTEVASAPDLPARPSLERSSSSSGVSASNREVRGLEELTTLQASRPQALLVSTAVGAPVPVSITDPEPGPTEVTTVTSPGHEASVEPAPPTARPPTQISITAPSPVRTSSRRGLIGGLAAAFAAICVLALVIVARPTTTIEKPRVEPMKIEQANVEPPKIEQPKIVEPRLEEPKIEPKIEEPKIEQPKIEQPKIEQPKSEQPKSEQPKSEDRVVEKRNNKKPRAKAPVEETQPPVVLPPRPAGLAQRVKYLQEHCATRAPRCVGDVVAKAQNVATLEPAEVARVAGDANRCLDECGAPR